MSLSSDDGEYEYPGDAEGSDEEVDVFGSEYVGPASSRRPRRRAAAEALDYIQRELDAGFEAKHAAVRAQRRKERKAAETAKKAKAASKSPSKPKAATKPKASSTAKPKPVSKRAK